MSADIQRAQELLRQARDLLFHAGLKRSAQKVRIALHTIPEEFITKEARS